MTEFQSQAVKAVFGAFPASASAKLTAVRSEIFQIGKQLPEIALIEESLKWGQPSYATNPKTGTPIRLGLHEEDQPALFVHCQTTLVAVHRGIAPPSVKFIDNRAILLTDFDDAENAFLNTFITAALTYHMEKVV